MTDDRNNLPRASTEMEAHVKEVFPVDTNPEEFAAKDGAGWLDFTFNDYRFADPALDKWIHAVGKIIRDPQRLAEVQRKYLSDVEREEMQNYMEDDFDPEDVNLGDSD